MASYLITGVSRGIGFEFLKQLSGDPANTIIGIVRDKAATDEKIKSELGGRSNIHILQADITDYDALKGSVSEVVRVTGGKLDYIIANAGLVSSWGAYSAIGELGNAPEELEQDLLSCFKVNVVGNIHLFNVFVPLILEGSVKKVIAISSGISDLDLTNKYTIYHGAPYSISKAALNLAVSKFHAQYSVDGVLFMSICPGIVDTGNNGNVTEEQMGRLGALIEKFTAYAPHFTGQPATTEASVKDVLAVINKASLQDGYGGSFISHLGNKQWL